uniref:Uncharacterized protein n=1 Tax=Picea glauca TaxID=3330 RepID=A0A101LYB3_PICGL|nr:hypothetical protein ABT39_MTgene5760 [Picea glauca]QHR90466.1 hypothetical protein Q903MT_gene4490 [Picea sitchensis]
MALLARSCTTSSLPLTICVAFIVTRPSYALTHSSYASASQERKEEKSDGNHPPMKYRSRESRTNEPGLLMRVGCFLTAYK